MNTEVKKQILQKFSGVLTEKGNLNITIVHLCCGKIRYGIIRQGHFIKSDAAESFFITDGLQ